MVRKGVSADEKMRRVVSFFVGSSEFYAIKELETKLASATGVTSIQVEDLLKQAVDERLIQTEKLGGKRVYWEFANGRRHFMLCENEKAQMAIDSYREDNARKRQHLEELQRMRGDDAERRMLLAEYGGLRARTEGLERMRWLSDNCSAEKFEALRLAADGLRAQINKVTDDIFTLKGFICGKYDLDKKEFNASFGVREDMDYCE